MFEIKSRYDDQVLFRSETASTVVEALQEALQEAVGACANLTWAYLEDGAEIRPGIKIVQIPIQICNLKWTVTNRLRVSFAVGMGSVHRRADRQDARRGSTVVAAAQGWHRTASAVVEAARVKVDALLEEVTDGKP